MSLVIDASAIAAIALEDENSDYAEAVIDQVAEGEATLVPPIFWFEIRNVLVINERRGRLKRTETSRFLALLEDLPIEIAPLPPRVGVLDLARQEELSVYDAAYLDLAMRRESSLASLDRKLRSAAGHVGVRIFSG